jgi:hypothetical protein
VINSERKRTERLASSRGFTLKRGRPAGIIGLDRDGHRLRLARTLRIADSDSQCRKPRSVPSQAAAQTARIAV